MTEERILALYAAGKLTKEQVARAALKGWLPTSAVDATTLSTVQTRETNRTSLKSKADTALTSNATYLALASPTTAQNTAQIKALTKQNNAIIRLLIEKLDSTSGT